MMMMMMMMMVVVVVVATGILTITIILTKLKYFVKVPVKSKDISCSLKNVPCSPEANNHECSLIPSNSWEVLIILVFILNAWAFIHFL